MTEPMGVAGQSTPEPVVGPSVEAGARPSGDAAAWARSITENELPLFAQNLSEISSVASRSGSSAADLASAITVDVSMSVRLLKIANSPLLNPQNRAVDSIRTAVVMMGFDAVRDLAFSLSLVQDLHKTGANDRVTELLAHAFHAGCQAQILAQAFDERSPEEAFVAGLLLDVGEMAFWSRRRPETMEITALLEQGGERGQAERKVLGFQLRDLTCRLAEEWRMGSLVRAALSPRAARDARCRSVILGDAVADSVARYGWKAPQTRRLLEQCAEHADLPVSELRERLEAGSEAAAKMARRFGIDSIERYLAPQDAAATDPDTAGDQPDGFRDPDPHRELEAVRQLQGQLQGKIDIDRLMRLALEGLHSGAGVDRAFFAMLSRDRSTLTARYAAGTDPDCVLAEGRFDVTPGGRGLFHLLLRTGKAIWVDDAYRQRLTHLIGADIERWAAGAAFFAMPIFVRDRPVGMLYADRSVSGRALTDETFTSFRFFGEQIANGLARR